MPRSKGRGEGRWKSLISGRFVSAYWAKRNPAKAVRFDSKESGDEESQHRPDPQPEG